MINAGGRWVRWPDFGLLAPDPERIMHPSAFGWLGAALSMSLPWPQVLRSCVQRRTTGLSATACWLGVAMPIGWITYGLLSGQRVQVVTNVVTGVAGLAILAVLLITRGELRTRRVLLTSSAGAVAVVVACAGSAALAAVPGFGGPRVSALLGAVLAVSSIVSAVPQPLALLRDRGQDLAGLSPLRWRLAAGAGASWLLYGVTTGQFAVWLSASVGLTAAVVVLAVLAARREPAELRLPTGAPVRWQDTVTTRSLVMAGV
jgi:uncharacterized protein with PQ loop repeat